jgi:hypothetical protein
MQQVAAYHSIYVCTIQGSVRSGTSSTRAKVCTINAASNYIPFDLCVHGWATYRAASNFSCSSEEGAIYKHGGPRHHDSLLDDRSGPWQQLRICKATLLSVSYQINAKFGTCTVVGLNGTLVEANMFSFTLESTHFFFNKVPI